MALERRHQAIRGQFRDTVILTCREPIGGECRSFLSVAISAANRKPRRLAESSPPFVIPGRSKERSDAAQTLGSIP
ncbi:hypothetical protein EJ066_05865 [Mesorhizobium sp. M9A.F.Ca.ET.002.03.1.2]|nr:hypothetical protein EJ066_05865 [Mesorhizobium sp. M9A.F.Ca.ET.002.03.1.2]